MITQEVVQKIRNIVGKEHTLDSDLDRFGYSYDSSFVPLFPASMPDLVVRPRTTEEVAEVMKIAYDNAIPVTARGTASGRTGGSIPLKGGIVLCLDRMTSVIELDQKNIEPKLDNLSKIEEELVNNNERMSTLNKLNLSFELAKEILAESYEEMRNTVTPKFTQELSKNISEITEKKYSKIMFNDEQGLIVELESGNYVPASKLSIGTIDQLYLSLRLSMIDELSEENLPIILDEAFAYYDTERLTNILKYLDEKYKTHQIILFTCTNREKEILEKIKVPYNLIEL